ncbi:MAG: hypothetical protein K2O12_02765, partial [Muribaculaceae bacterium]|nr:hypothetical protein [Muribaculaceae bacterium]
METILIISTVSALGIIIWLLIKTTGLKHKLNTAETEIKRFTLQEEHLIEENNSLSSKLDNISGSLNSLDRQIAIFKAKEEMDRNTIASMTESAKTMQERFDSAVDSISRLQTENTAMRTRLNFLESEKHKMEEETANRFKALATEILRQNTDTLKSQHESRLTELLSP